MNQKALIVDDSKMIRAVFSLQLSTCGFKAQSCESLDQTLAIIQNWQPGIVFLDLRMPDHDGFEVIERIQTKFSVLPKIVAVTGNDDDLVRQQVDTAGFDRFLLKPFRTPELTALLKDLLS